MDNENQPTNHGAEPPKIIMPKPFENSTRVKKTPEPENLYLKKITAIEKKEREIELSRKGRIIGGISSLLLAIPLVYNAAKVAYSISSGFTEMPTETIQQTINPNSVPFPLVYNTSTLNELEQTLVVGQALLELDEECIQNPKFFEQREYWATISFDDSVIDYSVEKLLNDVCSGSFKLDTYNHSGFR